jgi:Tfp pilus assembly protein PilO
LTIEAWVQVAITVIGWVALVTAMRSKISNHDDRIIKLEKNHEDLKTDYVPRPEVAVQLSSLKESVTRIEALLNAVLYTTGNKASVQFNQPR